MSAPDPRPRNPRPRDPTPTVPFRGTPAFRVSPQFLEATIQRLNASELPGAPRGGQYLSETRRRVAAKDATEAYNAMFFGDIDKARTILQGRLSNLVREGRDTTETSNVLTALDSGDLDWVRNDLYRASQLGAKYLR